MIFVTYEETSISCYLCYINTVFRSLSLIEQSQFTNVNGNVGSFSRSTVHLKRN